VDGTFSDWDDVLMIEDTRATEHPALDLVRYRALLDDTHLSLYMETRGPMFKGLDEEGGLIQVFFDTDLDSGTGFSLPWFGADYLLEICGSYNHVLSSHLYIFDESYRSEERRQSNDWNGWAPMFDVKSQARGSKLETQLWRDELEVHGDSVNLRVRLMDSAGSVAESLTFNEGLQIVQISQNNEITAPLQPFAMNDVLSLDLLPLGEDVVLDSLVFQEDSTAEAQDIERFVLFNGNEELAETKLTKSTVTFENLELLLSEMMILTLKAQLSPGAVSGRVLSLTFTNADCGKAAITLEAEEARGYLVAPPVDLVVDGLFSEWRAPRDDSDDEPVDNENADITHYDAAQKPDQSFFYLRVDGEILAGVDVPASRAMQLPSDTGGGSSGGEPGNPDITTQEEAPLPVETGEDTVYIFLDANGEVPFGYEVRNDFHATHMVEITGQRGSILSSRLLVFGGNAAEEWSWEFLRDVPSASGGSEIEASVHELGDELTILFHVVSWDEEEDLSDEAQALRQTPFLEERTRAADLTDCVGLWPFDEGEGTTAFDATGISDCTLSNNPTWEEDGRFNGALGFDGTNDYGSMSSSGFSSDEGAWEAWLKFDNPASSVDQSYTTTGTASETIDGTTNTRIAQKFTVSTSNCEIDKLYIYQSASGTLDANVRIETDSSGSPSGTLADTGAYANSVDLNANGPTVVTLDTTTPLTASTSYWLTIVQSSGSGTFQGGTTGTTDQVKYYDGSWKLSSSVENIYFRTYGRSQVLFNGLSEMPDEDTGLVGHWKMNTGSGDTVTDSSGSGNHGTRYGPSWTSSGKFGNALGFDGNDDYVRVADGGFLRGRSVLSIFFWAKVDSSASTIEWFYEKDVDGLSDFSCESASDLSPRFYVSNTLAGTVGALSTNVWHHIGLTIDGTTATTYLNGQVVDIKPFSASVPDNADPLNIGRRISGPQADGFHGIIDSFQVYNRALSEDEARSLYTGGVSAHKNPSNELVFRGGNVVLSTDVSSLLGWQHFAGTWSSSGVKLYRNGNLLSSDTTDVETGGSFGSSSFAGIDERDNMPYDGKMDGLALYDRALNPQDLYGLYNFPTLSNIAGYWAMDEEGGSTAYDFSSNARDLAFNNMDSNDWVSGVNNGGLNTDGDNDYLSGSRLWTVVPSTLSFEAWINPTSTEGYKGVMGSPDEWIMYILDGAVYTGVNTDGFLGTMWLETQAPITANQWTHVAATWDGDTLKQYMNGQEVNGWIGMGDPMYDPGSGSTTIGRATHELEGTGYFAGTLDGVGVYTQALQPWEFPAHRDDRAVADFDIIYHGGDGNDVVLRADMSERSGTSIADQSGNGKTGTGVNTDNTNHPNAPGGKGFYTDGSTEYASFDTLYASTPQEVSISFFMNAGSLTGERYAFYHGDNVEFAAGVNSGSIHTKIRTSSGTWYTADMPWAETDRWYHILGVMKRGEYVKLYVDGNLQETTTLPDQDFYDPGGSYLPSLGSYNRGSGNFFQGTISRLEVYDSVKDLSQLYNTRYLPDGGILDSVSFAAAHEAGSVGTSVDVQSVAVGDLDNNGYLDFVSATSATTNELRAWQNDGTPLTGTWSSSTVADLGSINALSLVDLDGDGDLDIVAGCASGAVQAVQNDGTPFDGWGTSLDVTGGLSETILSLAIGDLDLDGLPDVGAGRGGSGDDVWIFRNDGYSGGDGDVWDDTWDTSKDFGSSGDDVNSLMWIDLDQDGVFEGTIGLGGASDAVHVWEAPSSSIFTNDWTQRDLGSPGTGDVNWVGPSFTNARGGQSSRAIPSIPFTKIHDDSLLRITYVDVWAAGQGSGWVSVLENDDDYTFDWSFTEHDRPALDQAVNQMALGDFDNDGDLDAVGVTDKSTNEYEIFLESNRGGITFAERWIREDLGNDNDNDYRTVAAADFDNDGDLDVLTGREGSGNQLAIWENQLLHRNMEFSATGANVGEVSANRVYDVAFGDLDGDGDLDVIGCEGYGSSEKEVFAWENPSSPWTTGWTRYKVGDADANVYAGVRVADLDRDGDLDLVTGDFGNKVNIWQNDGTPFDGTWTKVAAGSPAADVYAVAVGDVDNDGWLDIVSLDSEEGAGGYNLYGWENDGTPFTGGAWTGYDLGSTAAIGDSLALGDLDNDGWLDIITGDQDGTIAGWENDGTPWGSWGSSVQFGDKGTDRVDTLHIADLDGDGWLDFISGDEGSAYAWENDGTPWGAWSDNQVGDTIGWIFGIAAGDLDRDGDVDLVTGDDDFQVNTWENDGSPFDGYWTGTVVKDFVSSPGYIYGGVEVGDVDNDGDLDILSGDGNADVYIWHNIGASVGYTVTDIAPASMKNSETNAILKIEVQHNGIATDEALQLGRLDFTIEESAGDPLTTSEEDALITKYMVFYDDGDGTFENDQDTEIAFRMCMSGPDGKRAIVLWPGLDTKVAATGSETFFLVIQLTANAESQNTKTFQITVDPDSGSLNQERYSGAWLHVQDSSSVTATIQVPEFGNLLVPVGGLMVLFVVYRRKRKRATTTMEHGF